jgi:Leucine Rich Repeat (LRR) protein
MFWALVSGEIRAVDFSYVNTNGTITITSYTGAGGAVIIPDAIGGLPVTSLGDWAFFSSNTVTSVVIPDSVTNIGDWTFDSCSSLTNVSIGNGVTSIGSFAFSACSKLTRVTIPDSVRDIRDGWAPIGGAFFNCGGLTNVTLGRSLTNIGDYAFGFCANLTSITVPDSVVRIGNTAFQGCGRMLGFYFQGNAPSLVPFALRSANNIAVVYYLPGTTGWGPMADGVPAVLWNPQVQTADNNFGVRQNRFGFNITGTADIPIVIEGCASLGAPTWIPLQSGTLTNGAIYFSDPQWTNYPSRLYRIRSP